MHVLDYYASLVFGMVRHRLSTFTLALSVLENNGQKPIDMLTNDISFFDGSDPLKIVDMELISIDLQLILLLLLLLWLVKIVLLYTCLS